MKRHLPAVAVALLFVVPSLCFSQVQQDWVRKFVGLGNDNAAGIAADNSGNVFICGNNNWGFNTADMYMIRYNSAGTQTAGFLYNSPYNNADEGRAIATDPAGNVYVAGRASVNSSTSDIVLIKYSSSAIQQWVTLYNSPENYIDDVTAMAVDAAGNVYLTGHIVKGSFEYDYLTLKFNTSGILLWSATYNGTANGVDMARDIAVDASGNVFVTGLSAGRIRKKSIYINTGYDYVTIKYNSSGAQLWVQRYNATGSNDEAKSVALDASGNAYVTGSSTTGSNNLDCTTIKYASDGTFHWLHTYAGAAGQHDAGNGIAVDGSGNAYVAGYSYNSSGRGDVLTLKYNTSGALLWTGIYDAGSGTHDIGKVMALDQYANVYVAAETLIPGITNSDYLTIKYTSSGLLSWAVRYNGPENGTDYPTAMVVVQPQSFPGSFNNANVYVTGSSNNDVVTIKYSQPIVIGPGSPALSSDAVEPAINNFSVSSYPNPVRSFTTIRYQLPADSRVMINVYDAIGRKVSTLVDGYRTAGVHTVRFTPANLSNGVYHYEYVARSGNKEFRETQMMVVQK